MRLSDARTAVQLLEARDKAVNMLKTALAPYGYRLSVTVDP